MGANAINFIILFLQDDECNQKRNEFKRVVMDVAFLDKIEDTLNVWDDTPDFQSWNDDPHGSVGGIAPRLSPSFAFDNVADWTLPREVFL